MPRKRMLILCFSFVVVGTPGTAPAQLKGGPGDWPGWRGADRTGVSAETGLLIEWPKEGPKLLWKADGLGGGYSTPSVAGGRIYLLGDHAGEEFAITLDTKDGKQIWSVRIGKVGPNKISPYPGTRSTPMVDGDAVYCLGSDGDLLCLAREDGKTRWQKGLRTDLDGTPGNWAYAESPLIDGDVLVCTPGGDKVALAALNKMTGDVIWKSQVPGGGEAAYASAISAEVGGVKQYVQFLRNGVVSVSAKDGKFLWSFKKGATPTNCSTPIFHDGYIFESEAGPGGGGCALLKLSADGEGVSAKEVYFNKSLLNHHGGVVLVGDYLYGTSGTGLVCMDFKTGEVKWQNRSIGKGSITAADGHLYVRGETDGQVALVEATAAGYKESGRLKQPDRSSKKAWPHPVIAGGCLYLRDAEGLLCYDIKGK